MNTASADHGQKNQDGYNGFMIACNNGHFKIVKLLIENNCKIDEKK